MKTTWKKVSSIILVFVLVLSIFAGCTNGKNDEESGENSPTPEQTPEASEAPKAYFDMLDNVEDSSDLPSWTGKGLKLKVWYAHGTGDANRQFTENDVVTPEIKRVTGVELDRDGSFDNGGQAQDVKLGLLSAANDWPDILVSSGLNNFKDLIAADKLYDLTDVIQKYAPNLAKKMSFERFPLVKDFATNNNQDGKIYAFPFQLEPDAIFALHPETDPIRFLTISKKNTRDNNTNIYVRDDILKKLYPNAKTQDEIEQLYMKNGKFSKEEIFDVPIKSKEDFVKFMYDIKTLIDKEKLKENGKPVQVTYAFGGQDNWSLLSMFRTFISGIPGSSINNYFTYYNKTKHQIDYMFKQDAFKEDMLMFNQMVRDGVMDPNSLLENNASHLEKVNNGQYAIVYTYDKPDETVLKQGNKPFRYRQLWFDKQYLEDQYIELRTPLRNGYGVSIFKDSVKEEDLPQIIRYLDFLISDVGENLYYWGPRSAGLYEVKNGKRVYKDKELEDNMVYGQDNGKSLYYNLRNQFSAATNQYGSAWPYYLGYIWGGSTLHPRYTYDRVRNAGEANSYFNPGILPGMSMNDHAYFVMQNTNIWNFFTAVPESERFWKARDSFEKALTKTLAAQSDAQFEQLFKSFLDLAEKIGATDEMLTEINKEWFKNNEGYADKIK